MAFNGTEGSPISIDVAAEFTENYRNQNPAPNSVIANFFGRDILNAILAQPNAMGIRFYFAINDQYKSVLVAVGADSSENDQINGIIADITYTCPPHCSSPNPLNTSPSS